MLPEEQQIRDLLEQMNDNGISHLTIGGIAAILYGLERPTYDIDIAVPEDLEILEKMLDILKKMGYKTVHRCPFPHDFLMEIDYITPQFMKDKGCLEFRNEDEAFFPVDILAVDPLLFKEISNGSIRIPYQGSFIVCPSLEVLIEMKEEVGRPQDKDDIEKLRIIQKKLKGKHYD
jgi:hypothetical protein